MNNAVDLFSSQPSPKHSYSMSSIFKDFHTFVNFGFESQKHMKDLLSSCQPKFNMYAKQQPVCNIFSLKQISNDKAWGRLYKLFASTLPLKILHSSGKMLHNVTIKYHFDPSEFDDLFGLAPQFPECFIQCHTEIVERNQLHPVRLLSLRRTIYNLIFNDEKKKPTGKSTYSYFKLPL